ncbi:MAG: hypothetical protein K8F52_02040 [Candidatus Scalindua rubra]|uniref:Uncharacterized protein n=1 Tax=Candidatus Scalindua brodae TaxID=237368 RepID=A0A0B0ENR7_9BACT|nr:MAG: hypothetical protein SCABRO_01511 [Candidatus Scalindua brodae]MBZ0107423.1 hypothetical protein [Candidatus Scalindua rubra]TWU32723.1 hypothetical protein S225a_16730 [Candidatus Brocadiaceae bacterium S225]
MLEKLYYDLSNDTDVDINTNSVGVNRLKTDLEDFHNTHFTIMDLVSVFADEADKVCSNKCMANLIALEAIHDYVKVHVNNVQIS